MLRDRRRERVAVLERELGERIAADLLARQDEQIEVGDRAVTILGDDVALARVDMHRREVRQIDEALRKLSSGDYGVCEECGAEIDERRLEILPFAAWCVDCKQRREAGEKLEPTGHGFRAGFRDVRGSDDPDEES